MFRGLYTATSGMMAHNRKQQILTNNLANANTPGYKQDQAVLRSFPEQLIVAMNAQTNQGSPKNYLIGSIHTGVYNQEGIPSFVQGALKETGQSTDVALLDDLLPMNPETGQRGNLVFAVQLANNDIRYTKNGQFTIDQNGRLTTAEGYPVLNENLQPIQVNSQDFTITDSGQIVTKEGIPLTRLWLGYTENPAQFVKEGHGLLRWDGTQAQAPQRVADVELLNNTPVLVKQGFIEQSNVDVTQTMTEMITTYRGFEANQKVIQAYDRSMEKTVNDIGRI